MVATMVLVGGCAEDDSDPVASSSSNQVTIEDPLGDTRIYTNDRKTDVTVNVDLASVTASYDTDGLLLEFAYAEPLDTDAPPPELIVPVGTHPGAVDPVYWINWYDGYGRPYITGEDEIRQPCRMDKAEVDRAAGRVTLLFPTKRGCLGNGDDVLVLSVSSFSDNVSDYVDIEDEGLLVRP